MYVQLDLSELPARVQLVEPEDFASFKVTLRVPSAIWVPRAELMRLAGDQAADPRWLGSLEGMLAYAKERGWARDDGAIHAHTEYAP